eukprot:CAMPEP_0179450730 /NCGR_PEP_ID=MMETSP0799-20121207/34702_1 /TAXON_ID=46947 /ORGANISM="Geminigera cryophila, Strain CCMP2564" /LENGTH=277 /DNA_ID=CAMNT_0021245117 /DNA_START=89 /DNA_END=919 /DNA_ORIENTATION=-
MKVLLVRHAQSHNNIVQARVHTKITAGVSSEQQAQHEWLSMRQDDPGLSPAGAAQLKLLQKHAMKLPRKSGCSRYKIVTSPMRRACQTAKALVEVLACSGVDVQSELCEVGGVYSTQADANGQFQKVRGNAMLSSQISQEFGFNTGSLPASGPWDGGMGFECIREALSRAERVASWMKLANMHQEMGTEGMLVIVSHADFLALLLATLTSASSAGAHLNPDFDVSAHGVSSHGVSEAQLGQSLGQKEIESVYKRFRISLACTTLLDISVDGQVRVVW